MLKPIKLLVLAFALLAISLTLYAEEEAKKFTLSSSAFLGDGALPVIYTCDGKNLSPQIAWSDAPAKTKSFAMLVSDPKTPKGVFYHWVLFNIPAKATEVPEGFEPPIKEAIVGKNDFGQEEYTGPCPPKGSVHSYIFTVYALDNTLSLKKGASAQDVLGAMQGHIVSQEKIVAVYSRWFT